MKVVLMAIAIIAAAVLTGVAQAQASTSNVTALTIGVSTGAVGGAFVPGQRAAGKTPMAAPTTGVANRDPSSPAVMAMVEKLREGSITSPITSAAITGAPATNLAGLIYGSMNETIAVERALRAAGISPEPANAVVVAMSGLGTAPRLSQFTTAARAFNAMVASAPAAALNDPQVLAIHAALAGMVNSIQ